MHYCGTVLPGRSPIIPFAETAVSAATFNHTAREHRRAAHRRSENHLAMQRQLNLIMNGKGGVGKSFFTVNFVQHLKDQKVKHFAIDTDNENSTLKRFHPEARFVNLSHTRDLDQLIAAIEEVPLVLVDCRAASTDVFLTYCEELGVFDVLENMRAALTVVSPVGHDLDSVEQLRIISGAFENRCRYVVVKNHAFAEQFAIYDSSETRKRLLNELAAKEITMPRLYNWLVASLHRHSLTVSAAAEDTRFTLMDRQRLKNWQRQFTEQIESVRELILPA